MINRKKHLVLSGVLLIVLIIGVLFFRFPLYLIIGLLFIHFFILMYGVLNLDANYFFESYIKGSDKIPKVSFTFDDGPSNYTSQILDIFKEHKLSGNFFVVGKQVQKNKELTKRIVEEGHLIGNHTYSHSHSFDWFPSSKVVEEIEKCNHIIKEVTGKKSRFFRPPNGIANPMIAKALKQTEMISIAWSIRPFDTVNKNSNAIYNKIIKQIQNGSIILLHDTMPHVVPLVSKLLIYCKKNNLKVVSLDELLNKKAYD